MVGETALRWEVISHSGPEESLERWKKNIEELGRCIFLFHSLRCRMMLKFNLETANGNIRLSVSGSDWASEPIIDTKCSVVYARPGEDQCDEAEAGCRSGQIPGVFAYPFITIRVCWDADVKLQTNIDIGHTLAWVVNNDTTILSKLDSIDTQLIDIGAWWALRVYVVFSNERNV